jgi:hypothetical protein
MVSVSPIRTGARSRLRPSREEPHVVRRRLTVRRLDPWSVLKFGAVANLALLAIGLLVAGVIWFVIDRLALVDQACAIALDVGFTECGINAGNLFRALILLGLLWVVVQTAVLVFLSFLHNLIADLTGGLTLSVIDDTPGAAARGEAPPRRVTTASTPPPRPDGPSAAAGDGSARTGRPPVEPLRRDTRDEPTRPHQPVPSGDTARRDAPTGPRREDDDDLFGRP